MDLGELHHRLCKKIAQLTKVIFFLNTKNDEYESNLKAVVVAYESEMDQIVKEYHYLNNRKCQPNHNYLQRIIR